MLPRGRREADILGRGARGAADDDAGERAGDGGDEDIDLEGEWRRAQRRVVLQIGLRGCCLGG